MSKINLEWSQYLKTEIEQDYYKKITEFLKKEMSTGKEIFPPQDKIFRALSINPKDVKVIIVGQDPYHNVGQANGLSFSVEKGITIPPSLKNIYKELEKEYGQKMPEHGDLSAWFEQGVMLLNTSLTVERNLPASHSKIGWERFTNKIIQTLSDNFENNVYILWGAHAKSKAPLINAQKNLILSSAHPSPFSVTKFYGNNHFKLANEYLKSHNRPEIDWFSI